MPLCFSIFHKRRKIMFNIFIPLHRQSYVKMNVCVRPLVTFVGEILSVWHVRFLCVDRRGRGAMAAQHSDFGGRFMEIEALWPECRVPAFTACTANIRPRKHYLVTCCDRRAQHYTWKHSSFLLQTPGIHIKSFSGVIDLLRFIF